MAVRLLGLREVPEDELAGIEAALDLAGIEHYQSPPGLFGLSPASLWVRNENDLGAARQVMERYQAQRLQQAREAWQAAKDAGDVPGLWTALRQRPWHAIGLLILVLGVLFALSLPMLGLGR